MTPSLTRFDVVVWFLRVQLWIAVVLFLSALPPFRFGLFGNVIVAALNWGVPTLILALFPKSLARHVLKSTAYKPLDVSGLRGLTAPCLGLALFVDSIGRLLSLGHAISVRVILTKPQGIVKGRIWEWKPDFSSAVVFLPEAVATVLVFLAGFFLACCPVRCDNS